MTARPGLTTVCAGVTGSSALWPWHRAWLPLFAAFSLPWVGSVAGATSPSTPSPVTPSAAARIVPGSEAEATVVFVARIINRHTNGLRAPRLHVHTPVQLPHQDITALEVEGQPERLVDRWGAPVCLYQCSELAPGANLVGRWTASATVRRFRWDWHAPTDPVAAALAPEEKTLYLRDGKPLALGDPVVRAAAAEAARGKAGPAAVLDGIFGLVMDRLSYDRDGKWQPASEVLASGKGSCSEYTYCFMALCRDNGLPARYVGGIVGRLGVPFHLDKVFHRFPQAHVPGLGWVDFDPTRTDRANNKRLYFGQTPGPMLLLSVGDGGDGSLTGADYLEAHSWADPKAPASSLRQAWWFAPPPAKVRAEVEDFRRRLAAAVGDQRLALVRQARAIGHPFVLPWLDDLLYETGPRLEAARAALRIGGQGELAAVVNCLGRLRDPDGDRQIGQLLDQFTGQNLGADRAKWNEWLKASTPRLPLPGDAPEKRS